jgi:hypothetical protein
MNCGAVIEALLDEIEAEKKSTSCARCTSSIVNCNCISLNISCLVRIHIRANATNTII